MAISPSIYAPSYVRNRQFMVDDHRAGARIAFLCGAVLLGACNGGGSGRPGANPDARQAVPVSVAEVVQRNVPVQLRAIAAVEPYATVTIKPQVAGQLTTVHFTEGQDVAVGDLLFSIDPRPFEAALRQAEGNLARDEALARDAESEATWKADLYKQGVATQREYESAQATAASRRATVLAEHAAAEKARLDLAYCSIRSPIDGRTGNLLVKAGNILKANETELVVINQLQPIYVSFSVPEQHLGRIREYQAAAPLPVQASIVPDDGPAESGRLSFINNEVDRSTGMIALKGTFTNENRRLWPGQYVNAVLDLTTVADAVVAPAEAIQPGPSGRFVYVVQEDLTVEMRPVETSIVLDGEMVVSRGLSAGERVVTEGHLRLKPGATIQIKNQPTTTPGATTQPAESRAGGPSPLAGGPSPLDLGDRLGGWDGFMRAASGNAARVIYPPGSENLGHPAENLGHPVENLGHPVENLGHPMGSVAT